jgi:hypothetical protein
MRSTIADGSGLEVVDIADTSPLPKRGRYIPLSREVLGVYVQDGVTYGPSGRERDIPGVSPEAFPYYVYVPIVLRS